MAKGGSRSDEREVAGKAMYVVDEGFRLRLRSKRTRSDARVRGNEHAWFEPCPRDNIDGEPGAYRKAHAGFGKGRPETDPNLIGHGAGRLFSVRREVWR
jgi:hypothetical protein